LHKQGLLWHNLLADTGYSSGENYAFLEQEGLRSFIPPHGTYKGGPEGFDYNDEQDHYVCPQGKVIPFKKVFYRRKTTQRKRNIELPNRCVETARYDCNAWVEQRKRRNLQSPFTENNTSVTILG
jgi:hypothetical protein